MRRKRNNHIGYPKPKHTNRMYIWIRGNSADQEAIFENSKLLMTVTTNSINS